MDPTEPITQSEETEDRNSDSRLLSEIVFYRTYAMTLPSGKKETYEDTVDRVENMHIRKFPQYALEIHRAMNMVRKKKVVPSMRSMQYAGRPIETANTRMYNCSFTSITNFRDIADILYLLCCGCGCGYSVQHRHISQLPVIKEGHEEEFQIPDTKEGWADSVIHLLENPDVKFNYSLIRPRGAPLSTGGTASGPETLELMHEALRKIIKGAVGRQLKSLEVHDIICMIGDLIVSGGSRRAALISLFDVDDEDMLECKKGWDWFNTHPHRSRANNSAVLVRSDPQFLDKLVATVRRCFANGTGEPGVFLTNDPDYGTNPCAEISLKPKQMCNLTEVNVAACKDKNEFLQAIEAATIIGTLQASYTKFTYVQPQWQKNCEEDALLGVSLTGTAQNWGLLSQNDGALLEEAAALALKVNEEWAGMIGIKPASRIGCVKPSGTTSALLGTTSGIHAAYADYYLRRVRIETNSPLTAYLLSILDKVRRLEKKTELQKEGKEIPKELDEERVIDPKTTPVAEIADRADETQEIMGLPLLETDSYSRSKINQQLKEAEERKAKGEDVSDIATSAAASVPASLVITMPISMHGAIVRTKETAIELLNRSAFIHEHFIQKSHRKGPNFHNVSLTVNYLRHQTHKEKDEATGEEKEVVDCEGEEEGIIDWIQHNYNNFAGISLFPDSSAEYANYPQLPFQEVDEATYKKWRKCWDRLGQMVRDMQRGTYNQPPASSSSHSSLRVDSTPLHVEAKPPSPTPASSSPASISPPRTPPNHISSYPAPSFSPEVSPHQIPIVVSDEAVESGSSSITVSFAQPSAISTPTLLRTLKEREDEDPLSVLIDGLAKVDWDPNAADKRKEILACAGGNCEYTG